MHYVRSKTIGPNGHTVSDPVRRDRLPVDPAGNPLWRGVEFSSYWARMARDGDVELTAQAPPDDQIEGYEAPEPKRRPAKAASEGGVEA